MVLCDVIRMNIHFFQIIHFANFFLFCHPFLQISHGLNYFCSIQFQPPTSSNNLCLRFCLILILWLQAMYFLTCLLRSSISLLSDWTRSQELLVLAGSCRAIVNPPPYEDDDFKLYKPNQNLFFY